MHDAIGKFDPEGFRYAIEIIKGQALKDDVFKQTAIEALTLLYDRRYNTGKIKRSSILHVLKLNLEEILAATPMIADNKTSRFCQIDFRSA